MQLQLPVQLQLHKGMIRTGLNYTPCVQCWHLEVNAGSANTARAAIKHNTIDTSYAEQDFCWPWECSHLSTVLRILTLFWQPPAVLKIEPRVFFETESHWLTHVARLGLNLAILPQPPSAGIICITMPGFGTDLDLKIEVPRISTLGSKPLKLRD